ncbi:cell growth regulator with RING finger domain protein 1 isoform X2 [Strongylocentrotus purpuratus]|uniref:RING-type domain-containing protein n=1 Tax=Strongylocentrotus purpuratus TaxID=7668 RepID=A0A7M7PW40_STRPU|nr:cell growth regulator with RING finger domain protein 1 isoform X2 [Strongylocentrotus purpuratus]|eukprot:XP_011665392.1 PREDICTED: cell growth regulator with RING finger domain protein 1 isoform X3 [Strongylocentrotus purpuratus]
MGEATLGDELLNYLSEFPSEIISVTGIILCVVIFYFYIQRLDIQFAADISHQDDRAPIYETKVMTSTLPFTVKFAEESSAPASLKDGVELTVQTGVPCFLQGFWVVDCTAFSEMLRSTRTERTRDLEEKLQDISCSSSNKYFLNADTSKSIHLKISDDIRGDKAGSGSETDLDLGPTPRSKYPLVILVSLHDEDYETWSHNVSIKMYMAADETSLSEETGSLPEVQTPGDDDNSRPCNEHQVPPASHGGDCPSDGGLDFSRRCIVCQNAPITRVIIPCRHACVCEMCLGVLNACPMCRGVISSHFRLDCTGNREDDSDEIEDGESDWKTRLWNMNETLNAWFGFR